VKNLIDIFKTKAEASFAFGSGTMIELNAQSNAKYPLIWMQFPLTITNNSRNNIIISQTYNFNLLFLQSGHTTDTQEIANKLFDDMNSIMVGYIQSIQNQFEQDENNPIVFGNASMINKKQDNVHFGWSVSVNVTLPVDSTLCCNMFEDAV
jgi:hypothetical protein